MYKFNFTTVTPLHISNGEDLDQNFHYTAYRGDVYKINHLKFSQLIAKREKLDFSEEITTRTIESWIKKHQLTIIDDASSYKVKIHETFQVHLNNKRADGKREIREFINSNGKFYIPASSIKGSILTPLGINLLGINPNDPSINAKVVIFDSSEIDSSKLSVFRFDRPPEQNLMCLDPGVKFSIELRKKGNLDVESLKNNLVLYSRTQIKKAKKFIEIFEKNKGRETKGSIYFKESLKNLENEINKCNDNEYLINIGFGGGTYFKIFTGIERLPKNNKGEFIHTSYTINEDDIRLHIGWCKLEIEEL